jgi:hypothetical protein
MLDQNKIVIDDFRGLYRWYDENAVPPNHFKDCLNLEFVPKNFSARGGIALTYDTIGEGLDNVRRIHRFEIPDEPDRMLVLGMAGGTGSIFDASVNFTTPILQIVGMTDFSMVSLFGRAYISPHNGEEGLQDTPIYVYDPAEAPAARIAGGNPPSDFDLVVTTLTPTVVLADVAAAQSFATGVPLTLTASPYIPPLPSTLKFTLVKGTSTITIMDITVVGFNAAHEPLTKVYSDKVLSLGPLTYTTFDVFSEITSVTPSNIAGAVGTGTLKIEVTGKPPGKIEKGYHIIAVAYETASGFITSPGPATTTGTNYAVFLVPKPKKGLTVSGIPDLTTLPAGVEKIHILASKAIPKARYTGNPDEYELFFVPASSGGIIEAGDTSANINFFDADLVDSADFLKDNMSQIPAGVAVLATSKGRLLVAGVNSTSVVGDESTDDDLANNTVIFGSKGGEPESFSKTDGFVIVKPGGSGIRNLSEYRSLIYAYKSTRTYVTQDNGGLPVEWEINAVDEAIGAECHSVSLALGSDSATEDVVISGSRSGLQIFNGTYAEQPLSWKIREVWDDIVKEDKFNQIEVAVDPVNKFIFIAIPFSFTNYPTGTMLYADYSDGLNWDTIKWCPWVLYRPGDPIGGTDPIEFEQLILVPNSIYTTFESAVPVLRIGSINGNIYTYEYKSGLKADDGTVRSAFFETSKLGYSEEGGVSQVTSVRMTITGPCTLHSSFTGPNDVVVETIPDETITTTQPSNILLRVNFVEDEFSYKGSIDTLNDTFSISKIWVFGVEAWAERPA